MLFNPQNATGFQDGIEVCKGLLCPAPVHPIVDVAESQNLINAIGRGHWHRTWTKRHHIYIAIDPWVGSEARPIGVNHLTNDLGVGSGGIPVTDD
jgi:hypothetical protein